MRQDVFRLKLLTATRKAMRAILNEDYLGGVVKDWDHKPDFKIAVSLTGPGPVGAIETNNPIYRWVSEGTSGPYPIFAGIYTGKSDKKALAIPTESRPKTKPGSIVSNPGFVSSDRYCRPYVEHPGIKPRKFDSAIAKKRQPWFKRQMEAALKEAVAQCGHAI